MTDEQATDVRFPCALGIAEIAGILLLAVADLDHDTSQHLTLILAAGLLSLLGWWIGDRTRPE